MRTSTTAGGAQLLDLGATADSVTLGRGESEEGALEVYGGELQLSLTRGGRMNIGEYGQGQLIVANGGSLSDRNGYLGILSGGDWRSHRCGSGGHLDQPRAALRRQQWAPVRWKFGGAAKCATALRQAPDPRRSLAFMERERPGRRQGSKFTNGSEIVVGNVCPGR